MLILFLNELSADSEEVDVFEAKQRTLKLLKVLRLIRKHQSQVALNSQTTLKNTLVDQRYSIAELLAGDEYRDEWRFLRGFENRSPISAEMNSSFDLMIGELGYYYDDNACIAMGWADQLETGVVSFFNDRFSEEWLIVDKNELDDAAEIIPSQVNVRNFSKPDHIESHVEWLQNASFNWLSEAGIFWQQREELYPYLRFLKRTESDMDTLRVSGASYYLVLQRLKDLNNDIAAWVELGSDWPKFSSKASPEAQNRKRFCRIVDNDEEHDFDWHLRFTGGIAGRIHFRICPKERKGIIAYLGRKLEAPIVR